MSLQLRLCLFCWLSSLLLSSAHAQQPHQDRAPSFDVPCQTRAAFSEELKRLVQTPERADARLDELAIGMSQTASGAWLFTVDRVVAAEAKPRTVREASCEAAVRAGLYVVSAWINALDQADAARPAPPRVTVYQGELNWQGDYLPATDAAFVPFVHQGFSVRSDFSRTLGPGRSAGGAGLSLSLWNQSNSALGGASFQYLGVRLFPHDFRLERSARNQPYQRPSWEIFLGAAGRFADFGPVGFYVFAELTFASHVGKLRASGQRERDPVVRVDFGPAVRWAIVTGWVLRLQAGLSAVARDRYSPDPSLVAALGLDVTVF